MIEMEEKKEKKRMSRTQLGVFMLLLPVAVCAVIGLPFAAIFRKGSFLRAWLNAFAYMYALFGGGGSVGGLLVLLIRTVDEDFLEKAGYGLWYGTFAGAMILGRIFGNGLTADTIGVSFGICALVCALIWEKTKKR